MQSRPRYAISLSHISDRPLVSTCVRCVYVRALPKITASPCCCCCRCCKCGLPFSARASFRGSPAALPRRIRPFAFFYFAPFRSALPMPFILERCLPSFPPFFSSSSCLCILYIWTTAAYTSWTVKQKRGGDGTAFVVNG